MNKLLKRGQSTKLKLYEERITAVDELKSNLINPPTLALPREDALFTIETDACNRKAGYVLLQPKQDRKTFGLLVTGNGGQATMRKKYDGIQQEFLAIV